MHFPKPFFRKSRGLWYVQLDGRQINLGSDRDAAFERYHKLMAEPQLRQVDTESLAAIIDAFLEWSQRNRSPDTYEWYRYRLQRFIELYPNLQAGELKPFHVEKWVDGYDFSVTSRRNYMRTIKRCMKWAKKQGYLERNPIEDLEIPSAEHREIAITPDEFQRFLGFIRNERLRDLVLVTWETGCRPQESLRVEARHVDLNHHRWVFPKSEAKMKRISRVIYLTDEAYAITRRLVLAHPEGPLFCNTFGKPWSTEAVNCAITDVQVRMGKEEMRRRGETIPEAEIQAKIATISPTRKSSGEVIRKNNAELRCEAKRKLTHKRAMQLVPRISLYALRHSWATNALQRGVDPLTVAILMGHEDPSMLSKTYQHLSLNPQHMLEQAKRAAG